MERFGLAVMIILLGSGYVQCSHRGTFYDVMNFVYQLCAVEDSIRDQKLECLEYYLRSKLTSLMRNCLSSTPELKENINSYCSRLTTINQWFSKYKYPPRHLTRVVSLAAFGKMICTIREARLPLTSWEKSFQKCFPVEEKIKKKQRPKAKKQSNDD